MSFSYLPLIIILTHNIYIKGAEPLIKIDALKKVIIDKQEYIDFTRHRFLIVAQKTKQDELK